MTTITMSAPAATPFTETSVVDAKGQSQRLGRLTGLFFILTFATAIPPALSLYAPALNDPAFVLDGNICARFGYLTIAQETEEPRYIAAPGRGPPM